MSDPGLIYMRTSNKMTKLTIVPPKIDPNTGGCSRIFAIGPNGQISLSFRRTSKAPKDANAFYTPDLGALTLYNVDEFKGLPSSIRKAGGWFLAMRGERVLNLF